MSVLDPGKTASIFTSLLGLEVKFDIILSLAKEIDAHNFYLAGGIVRNAAANTSIENKDIDLFVTKEGLQKLSGLLDNEGKKIMNQFGSVRWFPRNNSPFYYDVMVIDDWDQGLWPCENMTDVLNQFDFTANALAIDIKTQELLDPLNGLLHAQRNVLRAVRYDYPEKNVSAAIPLSRNSILWFRFYYYARKLNYNIEPVTQRWMADNKYREADLDLFKTHFFDPCN